MKTGLSVIEDQVAAIQATRRAAESLNAASENLRKAIDEVDEALRTVAEAGAISQDIYSALSERALGIRRNRNSMETFEFLCRVQKVMEAAWRLLP